MLALALVSAAAEAAPPDLTVKASVDDGEVRRWEHVLLVRTSGVLPESIGRAEAAALRAGGAVLDVVRSDYQPQHADHRMLVRTREPAAIRVVVSEMQRVPGVLWVTSTQLPETPTVPGGPSFMSAYTAELGGEGSRPGVFVHHDVPPVLDKRDLLETVPIPVGPMQALDGPSGGLTMNVSELLKRWRESSWRRREEKMKNADLPILPPLSEGQDGQRDHDLP